MKFLQKSFIEWLHGVKYDRKNGICQRMKFGYHITISLPLTYRGRVISVELGQYHGCWCRGSLRRQNISNHDIDYVK